MFDSIYTSASVTVSEFFLMALVALTAGFIYSVIMSFKIRSSRRFFVVTTLIPFVVGVVVTFVKGNIGAGVAIGGGVFGLIRFRSAQGSADEIVSILIAMCAGIAFGMGYAAYGVIILLGLAVISYLLFLLPVFDHKSLSDEKLLRITIPETLSYHDTFDDIFTHFLKEHESVGVKTTGMGSMYRLSFRIRMKDPAEEKAFIDELRTRNGNLEIAILPFADQPNQL